MAHSTDSKCFPSSGLISVIMPCFNAAAYLREAVESVLNQTYPSVELVVVDDGSTDGSHDILRGFGNKVVLIEGNHQGPPPPRNTGISVSRGEFIAFLDADDYWHRDCLEKLYIGLRDSNAVLTYCGWQNIGLKGPVGKPYVPPDYEMGDKLEYFLHGASPWPIHAALVRRSALEEVEGFDEKWPSCEDYDLWLRLALNRPIMRVPEVLAFYRHHKTLQTTSKRAWDAYHIWRIKKDFVQRFSDLVKDLPADRVNRFINGALLKRGYDCYWKRELLSARKIFRLALRAGGWGVKDLRYLLPALLPERIYQALISTADKQVPFR